MVHIDVSRVCIVHIDVSRPRRTARGARASCANTIQPYLVRVGWYLRAVLEERGVARCGGPGTSAPGRVAIQIRSRDTFSQTSNFEWWRPRRDRSGEWSNNPNPQGTVPAPAPGRRLQRPSRHHTGSPTTQGRRRWIYTLHLALCRSDCVFRCQMCSYVPVTVT